MEKDMKQLNKMKEQKQLYNAILQSFEEDLQDYIETIYANFHKFNLIQFYYDDIKNVNNFHFDECLINRIIDEKDIIIKHYINSIKREEFDVVPKKELIVDLNTKFNKIVKKANEEYQSYFDFELKDEYIKDFIKNRDELTIKQNLLVEKENTTNYLRKYVYFEYSLFTINRDMNITEFPYFIEPFKETISNNKSKKLTNNNIIASNIENKTILKDAKQKEDKKKNNGILIVSIIIAVIITLFNTLILPILGIITGIIASFIITLCTTKQPKTFK